MAEESKTEEKREEKEEREDSGAKLDKIASHLDSLHKRMDAYEKVRKDAEDENEDEDEREDSSRRKDSRRKDSDEHGAKKDSERKDEDKEKDDKKERRKDSKRRKDSEEEDERDDSEKDKDDKEDRLDKRRDSRRGDEDDDKESLKKGREENDLKENDSERKDSQPPAWAKTLADRLDTIEHYVANAPTEDSAKFAEVWNKAERLAQLHCDSNGAPKWAPGESLHAYTCRVLGKYKAHSQTCKDVDLAKVTEPQAFAVLTTQIYNDAEAAATKPENVPSGELRKVVKNVGGREIITWVARNDDACWRQFTNVSLQVGKFLRPPRGISHVPSEQA